MITDQPVTSPLHKGHDGLVVVVDSVKVPVDSVDGPVDSVELGESPFAIWKRWRQLEWRWSVSQTKGRHPLL